MPDPDPHPARWSGDSVPWRVRWTTRRDADPRAERAFVCGPVSALAAASWRGRPIVVTATSAHDYDCLRGSLHDCHASAVRVWDVSTGVPVRTLGGVGGEAIAVRPPLVVVSGWDGPVTVWHLDDGTTWEIPVAATGLALSPAGDVVTVGTDGRIDRWSAAGEPVGDGVATGDWLTCVDAGLWPVVVAGGRDAYVDGARVAVPGPGIVAIVSTVLDGRKVAVSAHTDDTVRVWDVATGELVVPAIDFGVRLSGALLAIAGHLLAVPGEHRVHLVDLVSGARPEPLSGHTAWCRVAAGDGTLFTATPGDVAEGVLSRWRVDGPVPAAPGHSGTVRAAAFVGGFVVTAGDDGTVRRWRAGDGTAAEPLTGHSGPVAALACIEDGGRPIAVSGGGGVNRAPDPTVRRWDVAAGTPLAEPIHADHCGRTLSLATARVAGRAVALSGGNDGRAVMWVVHTGEPLGEHRGAFPVRGLAVHGTLVAVGRMFHYPVVLWDPEYRRGDGAAPGARRDPCTDFPMWTVASCWSPPMSSGRCG